MILIAIVGIVLAVGIPPLLEWLKQDEIRGAVADGIARIRPLREQITRFAESKNRFPARADELDLTEFRLLDKVGTRTPPPVAEVAVGGSASALLWVRIEAAGALALTYELPLHKGYPRLTYVPNLTAGRVGWTCASEDIKEKYLPRECRAR